jgi:uncharacterized protein (DUF488 family)
MTPTTVFTIGHSNHPIEKFIDLLRSSDVNVVVDVRTAPYSKMFNQYNQGPLKESLNAAAIGYLFLGDVLGGRSSDPNDYFDGQVVYQSLGKKQAFKNGIQRIIEGSENYRIAIMCSEKDPLDCHRTLLISEVLSHNGIHASHILADGSIEMHENSRVRLLALHNLAEPNLFADDQERMREALMIQEKKIAYRIPRDSWSSEESK